MKHAEAAGHSSQAAGGDEPADPTRTGASRPRRPSRARKGS
jgi:hypothetical protein